MKLKEIKISISGSFKEDPVEQAKETKRLADMVTTELNAVIEKYSTLNIKGQSLELTGIELSGKEYV